MQLQKEIKEIKEKQEKIEDLGCDGECPLCERKLESHYQVLVEKLSTEIGEKKGAHWDIVQEYKNKKKELEAKETKEAKEKKKNKELERLVMEKKEINTRIAHEIREIEEWKKELSRLKTEIAPIRCVEFDEAHYKEAVKTITHLEGVYEKIIVLRAEIARTEEVKKNLAGLTKLEKRMVEEIKEVERQIESLAFDKAEYEQTKERYEKEKEELNEVRMDLLRKRNEWENVCRDIERMEEEIKEQERLLEEKEKEERDIIYLGLLEKIMNQFKVYMVGMIRPMLSEYASDMLIRLTDGKYSKMELDENYDVFIYDEGTSYEINRFSGGEEDLANLCLRLAISAVVVERSAIQTNFVILDEIFGSQDAIRKRNIITALNELSKKFRQIFLITHIEEVKDYMEYVLRVTEDEEGVSRVRMGE
jgi:exonuclease SbcC